jgi:hypothetical protein
MVKARDIWREKIRQAREPLFAELDIKFMRAVERGDRVEQQRIATEKQRLRDITEAPEIEAAQTVGELKAFSPLN